MENKNYVCEELREDYIPEPEKNSDLYLVYPEQIEYDEDDRPKNAYGQH